MYLGVFERFIDSREEFPGGLGFSIVTAVMWIQSLIRELSHAAGAGGNSGLKKTGLRFFFSLAAPKASGISGARDRL